MEKIWLKSYPKGVPAEIDVNAYRSIPHLFDANIGKYRDRPAYICMGKTITFGDVDRLSTRFGAWLQSKGLAKGARVAVSQIKTPYSIPGNVTAAVNGALLLNWRSSRVAT